jgi:integrase
VAQNERKATVAASDLTVGLAVDHYLTARSGDMAEGKLCVTQFGNYREVGDLIKTVFGVDRRVEDLAPPDFEELMRAIGKGRKLGPVSMGNRVQWIRTIFRWNEKHYGVRVRYGHFEKPSRREVRLARKGRLLFTPVEIRKMLRKASPAMKCFILLGINCGFGQRDCANVPRAAFDLRKKMLVWRRGKTGVDRACPLWPETVAALRAYQRPHSAEPSLMFITQQGRRWVREETKLDERGRVKRADRKDSIRQELDKVAELAGVMPRGFYTFRHTFRTMADGGGDVNAVRAIMGQSFPGLDEFYLHLAQRPDYLRRLRKVTERVRAWALGK